MQKKLRRRVQNYNKHFQIQRFHPERGLRTQRWSFLAFDRFVTFSRQPLVSLSLYGTMWRVWGKRLISVPPLIPRLPKFFVQVLGPIGIGSSPLSPGCSPQLIADGRPNQNAEITKNMEKLPTSWCPVAVQFQDFRDGELPPWHEGQRRTMSEKLNAKRGARQFQEVLVHRAWRKTSEYTANSSCGSVAVA